MLFKLIILATILIIVQCRPQLRQSFYNSKQHLQAVQKQARQYEPAEDEKLDRKDEKQEEEELDDAEIQNKNAKYEFSSDVEDHINDLTQHRQETRDGASVKGSYSYSDGYYKITVNYIADEDGYRVVGMESVPLTAEGPQVDLQGTASVSNKAHGSELNYRIVGVRTTGSPKINKQKVYVDDDDE